MANWYVATAGNDTTGDGSIATPYATLNKAYTSASAGDSIFINRDDTFVVTDILIVLKTNLTFDAYGAGALPRFSGNDWLGPGDTQYSAVIRFGSGEGNKSGNGGTVKNLEFYRVRGCGVEIYSDNCTVEDCTITSPCIHAIISKPGSNNIVYRNNTVFEDNYAWYYAQVRTGHDGKSPAGDNIAAWGSGLVNRSAGALIEGNHVSAGWGEAINSNVGASDFIVRNNTVYGSKIGIYHDICQDGEAYNNIIVRDTTSTSGGAGIAFNVEPWARGQASSAGKPLVTRNIRCYNNLIAGGYTNAGIWGAHEDTVITTVLSGIYCYNNTIVDCVVAIRLSSGNFTGSWFKNNIIHQLTATINSNSMVTKGSSVTQPVFDNNYFTVNTTSVTHTNSQLGSTSAIDLVKTTGWRTAAIDGITAADFAQDTTSFTGTATLGNGVTYTSDYYGNVVSGTPKLGGIQGADITGDTAITSVNGGTSLIEPSQANTFTGTLVSGVYSGTVGDGVDSQALSNVLAYADGNSGVFDTGTLTSIDNPIILTLTHDTLDFIDFEPSGWTASLCTLTAGLADAWLFADGITLARTTGVGNTSYSDTTFAALATNTIHAEFYVAAGTSGKVRVSLKNSTASTFVTRSGTIGSGSYASGATTGASGAVTTTETATGKDSIYKIAVDFTALADGTWRIEVGPEGANNGETVKFYGVRVWVNRSGSNITYAVNTPTVSDVTNLNTDDEVDPNLENTVNGTDIDGVYSATITDADTTYTYPVIWSNEAGTVAKFRSADLTSLTGTITFTANVGNVSWLDNNPRLWTDNSGGTATQSDYVTTHLGLATGTTLASGGLDWHSFKLDNIFTVAANDVVTLDVPLVQGTSGRVRVVLSNLTNSGYVTASGIFGNIQEAGYTAATAAPTITEYTSGDVTMLRIVFTSVAAGSYRLTVGPDSATVGANVHVLAGRVFVNVSTSAVTQVITVSSGGVVEPELTKKIKFSSATGRLKRGGALFSGTFEYLLIYPSGNSWSDIDLGGVLPIAVAQSVTAVAGEMTIVEVDLASGSINALLPSTAYKWRAYDNDADPFSFGEIQLTVE